MRAAEQEAVGRVEVLAGHAGLPLGEVAVVAPDAPPGADARRAVLQALGEVGDERPGHRDVGVDQREELAVVALLEGDVEGDAVRGDLVAGRPARR